MSVPLAERIRPKTLDDIVGQTHLLGENKPLRRIIERYKLEFQPRQDLGQFRP